MADPKNSSRSFDLDLEVVFSGIVILALTAILAAGGYGWVRNIGKLMNNSCGQGNYGCLYIGNWVSSPSCAGAVVNGQVYVTLLYCVRPQACAPTRPEPARAHAHKRAYSHAHARARARA